MARTMDTSNLPEYALRIRGLRARTGLSQEAFGKYLFNMPRRTVQGWERAERELPGYLLALIEEKVNRDFPIKEENE